jgi:hypothetical protein
VRPSAKKGFRHIGVLGDGLLQDFDGLPELTLEQMDVANAHKCLDLPGESTRASRIRFGCLP